MDIPVAKKIAGIIAHRGLKRAERKEASATQRQPEISDRVALRQLERNANKLRKHWIAAGGPALQDLMTLNNNKLLADSSENEQAAVSIWRNYFNDIVRQARQIGGVMPGDGTVAGMEAGSRLADTESLPQFLKSRSIPGFPAFDPGGSMTGISTSFLTEIKHIKPLTEEEKSTLPKLAKAGDTDARTRLIEGGLRLVAWRARQYQGFGVSVDDLVQEGNRGLVRAADAFKTSKNRGKLFLNCWVELRKILLAVGKAERSGVSLCVYGVTISFR